jgi:hypothetical protein
LNHPFCLFFYSWPRPNRERKLQLTPPGWTYQGRLWFLIYIPCSQNENISREIYMYTHFIYMYWMYWYCMDILFIYIYVCETFAISTFVFRKGSHRQFCGHAASFKTRLVRLSKDC